MGLFDRILGKERTDPNAKAWLDKAIALINQKKNDEAIHACDKAIEINPQYEKAWSLKSVIFLKQCEYDSALQATDKVIEINPRDPHAWLNKAMSLRSLGRSEEAIAALAKTNELNTKGDQYAKAIADIVEGELISINRSKNRSKVRQTPEVVGKIGESKSMSNYAEDALRAYTKASADFWWKDGTDVPEEPICDGCNQLLQKYKSYWFIKARRMFCKSCMENYINLWKEGGGSPNAMGEDYDLALKYYKEWENQKKDS